MCLFIPEKHSYQPVAQEVVSETGLWVHEVSLPFPMDEDIDIEPLPNGVRVRIESSSHCLRMAPRVFLVPMLVSPVFGYKVFEIVRS